MYEILTMIEGDLKATDTELLVALEKVFELYGYEDHHATITNGISSRDQDDDSKDFADFVLATYYISAHRVLQTLGIAIESSGDYDFLFLHRIFSALPKMETADSDVILEQLDADYDEDIVTFAHILAALTDDPVDFTYYLTRVVGIEPYVMQVLRGLSNSAAHQDEAMEINQDVLNRVRDYLMAHRVPVANAFFSHVEQFPMTMDSLLTNSLEPISEYDEPAHIARELVALMLGTGMNAVSILGELESVVMNAFADNQPTAILGVVDRELNMVDFNEED